MNIKKLILLLLLPAVLLFSSCAAKKTGGPKITPLQPAINENIDSAPLMVIKRDQGLNKQLPNINKSPEDAVHRYVVAQFTRDTKELLAAITQDLADKTGMSKFPYPAFGQSSPWVEQAEIWQKKTSSTDIWSYHIKYWVATSQGVLGTKTEDVDVIKVNEEYLVSNSSSL